MLVVDVQCSTKVLHAVVQPQAPAFLQSLGEAVVGPPLNVMIVIKLSHVRRTSAEMCSEVLGMWVLFLEL